MEKKLKLLLGFSLLAIPAAFLFGTIVAQYGFLKAVYIIWIAAIVVSSLIAGVHLIIDNWEK